jgi:hypothetical protein
MRLRALVFIAGLMTVGSQVGAASRSCHIVECRQVRSGEVCKVRACETSPQQPAPAQQPAGQEPLGQKLVCLSGRYTVGDGYKTWNGGTQAQCERRCADDPNCNILEYYYGSEGVKCNLYFRAPKIKWNRNYDATVCAWQ